MELSGCKGVVEIGKQVEGSASVYLVSKGLLHPPGKLKVLEEVLEDSA